MEEKKLLSPTSLAKRWDYTPATISNFEKDGIITRIPNLPSPRYSIEEIEREEGSEAWEGAKETVEQADNKEISENIRKSKGESLNLMEVLKEAVFGKGNKEKTGEKIQVGFDRD